MKHIPLQTNINFREGARQGRKYGQGIAVTECSQIYKEACPTEKWNAYVLETKRKVGDDNNNGDPTSFRAWS